MNTSAVSSPPSIFVRDMNGMNGPRLPPSRAVERPFSSSSGPMTVPNARSDEQFAPPPLPPPRYLEDLAAGSDPGWNWGNTPNHGGFGGNFGSSRSSCSSMRGSWDQRMEDEGFPERPDYSRRGSSNATVKSPAGFDRTYDFSRNFDEGYHSLSGSSLSNHRSVDAGAGVPLTFPSFILHLAISGTTERSLGSLSTLSFTSQLSSNPSLPDSVRSPLLTPNCRQIAWRETLGAEER